MKAVKDTIEGGIRTVFTHEGLDLKKILMVLMGNFNPYLAEKQVDSAITVSFMKRDLLHDLKIRYSFQKVEAVDEIA